MTPTRISASNTYKEGGYYKTLPLQTLHGDWSFPTIFTVLTLLVVCVIQIVMKRLDSLRMNFFWEGNSEKNKIHLVNWESCLTSKKNGGAGIKNMKIPNQSLMMKWIWNFNSHDQPLRKKVIREKYGLDGRWNTKVSNSPYGVNLWKSTRNLWPKLLTKTMFSIGNGKKVDLWNDKWIEQGQIFPQSTRKLNN